jgi:Raf kinase inhibitor-like YbhB/YbcL family protein
MKIASILFVGAALVGVVQSTAAQTPQRIAVSSPTLKEGETIPRQYTPDGRNDSPPLTWTGVPAGARELAVVCEDPDAGNPPPFVHWVVYKIPVTAKGLPEALPIDSTTKMPSGLAEAVQGTNGFRRTLYRGPAPPPGKPHHYHFVVYALDAPVAVKAGQPPMTRAELLDVIEGHVIGQGELVALYERQGTAPEQEPATGRGRGRGRN